MKIDFNNIQRIKTLSQYIELDEKLIIQMAENIDAREITVFTINQRNKKRKVVKVRSNTYKYILKVLAVYLNEQYKIPDCVYGYVKGKSVVQNSKKHLTKKYVLKVDIKDFFYSISIEKVKKMFLTFTDNEDIAILLSKLVTYDEILYPGLITSPIISNIILKELDHDFIDLVAKYGCIYSRYADDITISTDDKYPSKGEIENILKNYGFCLNEKKFCLMKRGQTQVVTGLSIFDENIPRIPRKIKNKIKTACFLAAKMSPERFSKTVSWCSLIELDGLLQFYSKIEPDFVNKMIHLKRTGKYKEAKN